MEVPRLQHLLQYVCRNGFEHYVAMSASNCSGILAEAFENYLGWETYLHNADVL